MKRFLSAILIAAIMLLSAGCSATGTQAASAAVLAEATEVTAPLAVAAGASGTTDLAAFVPAYTAANAESYAKTVVEKLAYDEALLSNALGYRSAGSEAEHAAADWLAEEMTKLGLTDVEKIGVTVDLWEFRDAELTLEGTDISIMPASYQVNGTAPEGITAEIVDCGYGFEIDYIGVDVKDKIALVGVDQFNESWISGYMAEAYYHGAAALVTYDIGGYGTYDDDQINVQDVCQDDLLPTVAISYNNYLSIADAMAEGHTTATLKVDATMVPEGGTSYNVCGRIPGQDRSQQIMISGHYDVYFHGVQDDSAAIGLVLGIAKTMLDSGYKPMHDIVFMAHGSEEWGATGTEFDWTTGAWELINNVRPEWAKSTVAMINFELPAFYDGMATTQISCVPEYANVVQSLVEDSKLLPKTVNGIYPEGYDSVSVDSNTMEDGISYRFAGVPYFVNIPGTQPGPEGWIQMHYHTPSDDMSTYNADVMATNINTYGILAMYVDQMPTMNVDFIATAEDLSEAAVEDIFALANADYAGYCAALENFRLAAFDYGEKIAAVQASGDFEKGAELNARTHEIFKAVQDNLIGIIASSDVVVRHVGYQENIGLLIAIIDALENAELGNDNGTGALDLAWALNGAREYTAYIFSQPTVVNATESISQEYNEGNMFWGTDKGYRNTDTYLTTMSVLSKAGTEDEDYEIEISEYQDALSRQLELYVQCVNAEISAMNTIADMMAK